MRTRDRLAERVFRLLLRAYPSDFRRRYGAEQIALLRELLLREAPPTLGRWLRWFLDLCRKTLASAVGVRLEVAASRAPVRRRGFDGLRADLRDALRSLRQAPAVPVVAVASLVLAIGATTAVFSLLDSLTLQDLPVREPRRLVLVGGRSWTNPIWEQLRERQTDLFDGAFAWAADRFDLSPQGESDVVNGLWVSGEAFDVLGVPALVGRAIRPEDDRRGGGPDGAVAVISYRFWQGRFGGRPDIVGQPLTIERVPFTIVGVAPREFLGPNVGFAFDIAIPIGTEPLINGADSVLDRRSSWWLDIMGRLRSGQTVAEATEALHAVQPLIREATIPEHWRAEDQEQYLRDPLPLAAAPGGVSGLRTRFGRPLQALLVVAALVLAIASANIANLLLARASARRRDLALRLALGASRLRLFRLLATESLVLAALGAVGGLALAQWLNRFLVGVIDAGRGTVFLDLTINWQVLGFTCGVAILTALLFGLAPALGATRLAPASTLHDQTRGAGIAHGSRFRHGLVVGQVALSLVLVVAAGLFVRTFTSLADVDLGFDDDRVLVVNVNALTSPVAPDQRLALYDTLTARLAGLPGVASAAASFVTPVSGSAWNTIIEVPGGVELPESERLPMVNYVSPGWFETYGTPVLAGRGIEATDRQGAELVAVVNQAFADRYLGGEPPIGRPVRERQSSGEFTTYRIVGLVGDAVYRSPRRGVPPTMYLAAAQYPESQPGMAFSLRAAGAPAALAPGVTAAIAEVDPALALSFELPADQVATSMTQERLMASLAGFFGGLGLFLAALGLYGVTSYGVSRRRGEIGVRLALGADPDGIVRLVLRQVGRLVLVGTLLGAVASLWVAPLVESLLYGLEPRDPGTLAIAALVLGAVGLASGLIPARRAARVDPATVLRQT